MILLSLFFVLILLLCLYFCTFLQLRGLPVPAANTDASTPLAGNLFGASRGPQCFVKCLSFLCPPLLAPPPLPPALLRILGLPSSLGSVPRHGPRPLQPWPCLELVKVASSTEPSAKEHVTQLPYLTWLPREWALFACPCQRSTFHAALQGSSQKPSPRDAAIIYSSFQTPARICSGGI